MCEMNLTEGIIDLTLGEEEQPTRVVIPSSSGPNLMALMRERLPLGFQLSSRQTQFLSQSTNWTCGYTNILMLVSSFEGIPFFPALMGGINNGLLTGVADVMAMIELAWADGYDEVGCRLLSPLSSGKWIGATEVVTVLRYMGARSMVVDFTSENCTSHTGGLACICAQWLNKYFSQVWPSQEGIYVRGERFIPPVYLQYVGHSVTIVGIHFDEAIPTNSRILIFDPRMSMVDSYQNLQWPGALAPAMEKTAQRLFCKSSYQIVYVSPDPLLEDERDHWKIVAAQPHEVIINLP